MRIEPISFNSSFAVSPNQAIKPSKSINVLRKKRKNREKIKKKQTEYVDNIAKNYDSSPYAYDADGKGITTDNSEFDERV